MKPFLKDKIRTIEIIAISIVIPLLMVLSCHAGRLFEEAITLEPEVITISSPVREASIEVNRQADTHGGSAMDEIETIEQVKDYIRETSEFYGVEPELALKIAECESNFRNVCNEKYGCSSGIGIYQILQSTFDEVVVGWSPHNIKENISVAIWLMSEGELWRWQPSKHCWHKDI